MSFAVRLSSDLFSVEAGSTVPIGIQIANRSEEADQFELEIEGIDPEWAAVPVANFSLPAQESAAEKIFLKPPRVSESLAGDYPFVVRVRSLNTGESRTSQGVLQIKPFHYISMEIGPKKGHIGPFNRRFDFALTVMNLGNTDHHLQLVGFDPEDACTFDFDNNPVAVSPGQQKEVEVSVGGKRPKWFSGVRLHGFTITARSLDTPSVISSAQGQLERRPLLSPGAAFFLIFVLLLGSAWFALLPKPPRFHMEADTMEAVRGVPFKVSWFASNANEVAITVNGRAWVSGNRTSADRTFLPDTAGTYVFEGYASHDAKQSPSERIVVSVKEPPPIADPVINQFKVSKTQVKVNEPFTLSYNVSPSVTKLTLSPTGEELNLKLNEKEITRSTPGVIEYKIVAENTTGKSVSASVKVTVVETSAANIIVFTASTSKLDVCPAPVTIAWQTATAVRAELSDGSHTIALDKDKIEQGSMDIVVNQTSTFTLTVYDDKGLTTRKMVQVKCPTAPRPNDPGGSAGGAGVDPNPTAPRSTSGGGH
ncbi:MAG: hypothetical protein JSS72_02815 [Armatimonadetes bacterium]|nr:hypothetical protein [Armatimonadota bacterium]